MGEILIGYDLNPTTWVYISSLMIIGIYFKFGRAWSVRNLDLFGLIVFAPGLLLIDHGRMHPSLILYGYTWLLVVSAFFLLRMLLDVLMVRRPLLEPNLSSAGLTFTAVALLVFLTANVVTGKVDAKAQPNLDLAVHGPGYPMFYRLAGYAVDPPGNDQPGLTQQAALEAAARTLAILSHLLVVTALALIGYRHFDNIQTGVAAGALYLLLPYTAGMTNCVDHVVPGALLIWAVQCYRRPLIAGLLVGVAAGVVYYPIFLLPLWGAFYLRRGLTRFLLGVFAALAVMVGSLALAAGNLGEFLTLLRQMLGWATLIPEQRHGFWEYHDLAFRVPVMVAFVAMCIGMALWPPQKNLGTLMSLSAAVMIGAQFWQPVDGGLYMAWYLPLLIVTIFRPNLEDRVALATVRDVSFRLPKLRTPAPAA